MDEQSQCHVALEKRVEELKKEDEESEEDELKQKTVERSIKLQKAELAAAAQRSDEQARRSAG